MKLIILIILISCGKHEEPQYVDIRDKDGDQLLNHEEESIQKYVAHIDEVKKVHGSLSFKEKEVQEIPVSNDFSIKDKILNDMTIDERFLPNESHLLEGEKLKIQTKEVPLLTKSFYQVDLKFSQDSDSASELILKTSGGEMILGKWEEEMSFQLSKENLSGILRGEFFLFLRKNLTLEKIQSIKKKTYKLHLLSKQKTEIMYVSKELGTEAIKHSLGIYQTAPYIEDHLLMNEDQSESPQWFLKELQNGDKFLVHISPKELSEKLKSHFVQKKHHLLRLNGQSASHVQLSNSKNAKVYLKIHSFDQTLRTFKEVTKNIKHGHGGGGGAHGNGPDRVTCTHFMRVIDQETHHTPSIDFLIKNINEVELIENMTIFQGSQGKGNEWVLNFVKTPENMSFSLNHLKTDSYVLTGEYHNSCSFLPSRERESSTYSNLEGKLSIEIESFVEKIL